MQKHRQAPIDPLGFAMSSPRLRLDCEDPDLVYYGVSTQEQPAVDSYYTSANGPSSSYCSNMTPQYHTDQHYQWMQHYNTQFHNEMNTPVHYMSPPVTRITVSQKVCPCSMSSTSTTTNQFFEASTMDTSSSIQSSNNSTITTHRIEKKWIWDGQDQPELKQVENIYKKKSRVYDQYVTKFSPTKK